MRKAILISAIIILWIPLPLSVMKFLAKKEIIKPALVLRIDWPLTGAFRVPKDPVLSIKNALDGTFQRGFDAYFNYEMFGRPSMTRIYNQILHSFFKSTNTTQVIVGKGRQLYEYAYPLAYVEEASSEKKAELLDNMKSLALLQKKIGEMGKLFLVLVSTSKASMYPEYLPNDFARYAAMKKAGAYSENMYEYFISAAKEAGLEYFDFHDGFLKLKENGMVLYTKGGTHLTGPAATVYYQEVLKVIRNTGRNIGTLQTVKATPVWGNAFIEDDDLERVSNFLPKYQRLSARAQKILFFYKYLFPKNQFYSYHMETLSVPTDYRPSVFLCGDSSCWYWLYMLFGLREWVTRGEPIFSSVEFSWYNAYITKYPEDIRISDTTDDFRSVLSKDIIIIALNEANIRPGNSMFTFAKNLLNYIKKTEGE